MDAVEQLYGLVSAAPHDANRVWLSLDDARAILAHIAALEKRAADAEAERAALKACNTPLAGALGYDAGYEAGKRDAAKAVFERVFRHGFSDGWRANQSGRLTAPVAADEAWRFYVSDGALTKSIEAGQHRSDG